MHCNKAVMHCNKAVCKMQCSMMQLLYKCFTVHDVRACCSESIAWTYVAVCCSVLKRVAVCYSVLQYVAVC